MYEIYYFFNFYREIRNLVFAPIRPFTQLHAVWHTLAAIGSYYHVLFRLVSGFVENWMIRKVNWVGGVTSEN